MYIARQDTPMRKAVTTNRPQLKTLYLYLASTFEYRTITNLFGVTTSFMCTCQHLYQGRL